MDLGKQKILNGCVLGMEFEFYSENNKKEVAKEIGRLVKKKIVIGDAYHSEGIDPTQWKIEPDFSLGMKGMELVTPPLEYNEAIACMYKIFGYMQQYCSTDEKCAFQFNISFDKFKLTNMKDRIEAINRLKFVLGFDEEYVYSKFPKRKSSIYARSINSIFPINKFVFADDVAVIHKENYELPSDKYYGINFSKLTKGYLEIRYLGGRNYEKRGKDIQEIIEYVCIFIYNTLQDNYQYTLPETSRLKLAMKDYTKVVSSFSNMESFFLNYPNIKILTNLKGDEQIIKTFWTVIRDKLFDLIVRCSMRRGIINYDSDISKFQVKDAILSKAFPIKGMELFDCKIQMGNIIDCDLYRCTINNAHILDSNLYNGNKITKSKIINTPFHSYNECEDTYIDNKLHIINGKVEGGIIRSGDIGPTAKISSRTEIIDALLDSKDGKNGGPGKQGGNKDKDMPKTATAFRFKLPTIDK